MRSAVVTGTTHGIGTVTATRVAAAGYRLIMLVRDLYRAETLATAITETTGNDAIEVVRCDLSSIDSVNSAVSDVRRLTDDLHLLINNAGIVTRQRTMSADGIELTFATNHLGPFMLTMGLRSALECAGASRVVNVASAAYRSRSDARRRWCGWSPSLRDVKTRERTFYPCVASSDPWNRDHNQLLAPRGRGNQPGRRQSVISLGHETRGGPGCDAFARTGR